MRADGQTHRRADGRTDIKKLIDTFCDYAKATKKWSTFAPDLKHHVMNTYRGVWPLFLNPWLQEVASGQRHARTALRRATVCRCSLQRNSLQAAELVWKFWRRKYFYPAGNLTPDHLPSWHLIAIIISSMKRTSSYSESNGRRKPLP
jgi:hypothetical protein